MIRAKHRRLATHAGDLNLPFIRRMAKLRPIQRKQALLDEIARLGWRIVKVSRKFSHKFWLRNTAYHRILVLGSSWSRKGIIDQCLTLLDEIGHIRQRIRLGRVRFLAMYAVAEWRWALEVSAHRAALYLLGRNVVAMARRIYKFYKLGRMSRSKVLKETVRILEPIRVLRR